MSYSQIMDQFPEVCQISMNCGLLSTALIFIWAVIYETFITMARFLEYGILTGRGIGAYSYGKNLNANYIMPGAQIRMFVFITCSIKI